MNGTIQTKQKPNLNNKQRFSYGVGSVLNDIFRQLYISFTLVFLMQVVGLPASKAGLALLIAQTTDACISPITGYFGDKVRIPFISNKIGCRKSWHLVGTILMAVALPLLFYKCLLCSQYQDVSWLTFVYYACLVVAVSMAYNIVEINHLSIVITAAETVQEGTAVNAIRTVFSFLSGIFVYVVAWGLLRQDSGEELGAESVTQFAHLTWIATGTGMIFVIVFYIGTKEPASRHLRKISTLMDPVNVGGLLKARESVYSVVENVDVAQRKSSTIAHSLIDILMSSIKSEEGVDEDMTDTKTSLMQRFVNALYSKNEGNSNHGNSAEETPILESTEEKSIERPGSDLTRQVGKLNHDRKTSLVMRFLDELVHMTHQKTSEVTVEEKHLKHKEESLNQNELECIACGKNSEVKHSESAYVENNERDAGTSKNVRQRKRGMSMSPEDSHQIGIFNQGYQNESIPTETRGEENNKYIEPCCGVDVHLEVEVQPLTKTGKSRKMSFFEEQQHERKAVDEAKGSIHEVSCPEKKAVEVEIATLSEEERQVGFAEKEGGSVNTGTEKNSIDITGKADKKEQRTIKDWLMDPFVYKVAVIVTCSRLVQDAVYAYLPLYLTERLGFGKQSIAYFPLVLLVSAAMGSTVSDKLNTKIGSKWTYILASVLVICASVYCYFQTSSLRQNTYAPVIVMGSGMSLMYVMALAFVTELIGDDKETSGSVLAIIVFIGRISSGCLFMAIQEFYPEKDSDSNASTSAYVQYVFSMVPAILALTGSLVVMFFQSSSLCSTRKEYSPNEEATVQSESSATSFDAVVISKRKESFVSLE